MWARKKTHQGGVWENEKSFSGKPPRRQHGWILNWLRFVPLRLYNLPILFGFLVMLYVYTKRHCSETSSSMVATMKVWSSVCFQARGVQASPQLTPAASLAVCPGQIPAQAADSVLVRKGNISKQKEPQFFLCFSYIPPSCPKSEVVSQLI